MAKSLNMLEYWPYLVSGLVACVCLFGLRFIQHRRFYKSLVSVPAIGLCVAKLQWLKFLQPTPPHSLLLGNLAFLGKSLRRYPKGAHPQIVFTELVKEHGFRGLFYLDLYPFAQPMLFIVDPTVATQLHTVERHPFANDYLRGLVGTKSVFSTNGKEWQAQRSWFAPAFSMSHLVTLVPGMVEETLVFREKLAKYAVTGETFPMLELAIRLTIDVISRSGFDMKLKSQSEDGPIYDAFQGAISWTAGLVSSNFRKILSPYMMDYYTRKLDKLLGNYVKERYAESMDDKATKSILDLALRGYRKENGKLGKSVTKLDREFLKVAVDNFKTFLIGGHDTTASLITYTFYLLSTHPDVLTRMHKEHEEVFGQGFETTMQTLKDEPHLLNQLPLTLAVFKETLRLFPVGFIIKKGGPNTNVTFEGRTYPTDGHMVALLAAAMHRDEGIWQNPTEFDPDRFLTPGKADNDAFQPFAKGPRNCIGQQLAIIEAKVIVVLTLRFFNFQPAFRDDSESVPNWGGKGHQIVKLTAKPKDGIPMKVKMRN